MVSPLCKSDGKWVRGYYVRYLIGMQGERFIFILVGCRAIAFSWDGRLADDRQRGRWRRMLLAFCSKSAHLQHEDAFRRASAAADHRQDADATTENAIALAGFFRM